MSARLEPTNTRGIYRRGRSYVFRFRDHRGRVRQRSAPTLAEARAAKAALTTDVRRGEYRELRTITLADYAATWAATYAGRTGRGIRPNTLADYRRDLERHVLPRLGRMRLAEIEPRDVKLLTRELAESGLGPSTVRNVIAPLRALLQTAVEEGVIRANPALGLRLPGPARGVPKHLEPEELERLYAETPGEWRLFVRLLAYTGCRIGEFVELRWRDLDLEAGRLSVSRRRYRGGVAAPKSAYGVRTLPLPRSLVVELARHRLASAHSGDEAPLFPTFTGTPLLPENVARRVFKPAVERAGVGWASFHTLRHTCGTLLARKGLRAEEIQAWLGHHAASFTQDSYIGRPKDLPDPNALGLDTLAADG
jgi:integrase